MRPRALINLVRTSRNHLKAIRLSPNLTQQKLSYSTIEEKGRGEEAVRFRKEDERLLRQLLNKVKASADAVDVHEAESSKSVEIASLKEILGKYSVSDADLEKVIQWKHASA